MTGATPYFLETDEFVKIGDNGYYVVDEAPKQVKKDFEIWINRIKELHKRRK